MFYGRIFFLYSAAEEGIVFSRVIFCVKEFIEVYRNQFNK